MIPLEWIKDLEKRTFAAGEDIIVEGESHPVLFFLAAGKVDVVRDGISICKVSTAGSVLGEMSFLLDRTATATVRAKTEAECYVAEDPLSFLQDRPKVAVQVAVSLAFRLDAASKYLVNVKEQLGECSDHVGMVDSVLDSITNRDLKQNPPVIC